MTLEEILRRRAGWAKQKIRTRYPGGGQDLFVAIVCNNCHREEIAPTVTQLAPKLTRWYVDERIGQDGDLCPECLARLS